MFYAATQRLEVTKSLDRANELLNNGWCFYQLTQDEDGKFVFLLGKHDRPRKEALTLIRVEQNAEANEKK